MQVSCHIAASGTLYEAHQDFPFPWGKRGSCLVAIALVRVNATQEQSQHLPRLPWGQARLAVGHRLDDIAQSLKRFVLTHPAHGA